jgi:hypothetical protein
MTEQSVSKPFDEPVDDDLEPSDAASLPETGEPTGEQPAVDVAVGDESPQSDSVSADSDGSAAVPEPRAPVGNPFATTPSPAEIADVDAADIDESADPETAEAVEPEAPISEPVVAEAVAA